MEVEQWCVRVALSEGERVRKDLKERGLLDPHLRPRTDGETLLLPVTEDYDPDGAERLRASRPSLHTVLLSEGPVEGQYRVRRFTVLAGLPTTRTRLTEYGHRFDIDLALAYFSPRLSTERQRVLGRYTAVSVSWTCSPVWGPLPSLSRPGQRRSSPAT
ncbi:MAG: methyltransferase [Methanomicrobiales archaeon]|nr:methyltransferase [Methanomicrobiales archaeon]